MRASVPHPGCFNTCFVVLWNEVIGRPLGLAGARMTTSTLPSPRVEYPDHVPAVGIEVEIAVLPIPRQSEGGSVCLCRGLSSRPCTLGAPLGLAAAGRFHLGLYRSCFWLLGLELTVLGVSVAVMGEAPVFGSSIKKNLDIGGLGGRLGGGGAVRPD